MNKKKIIARPKTKAPIPMGNTEPDIIVRNLIDLFAGAIQTLNGGVLPMPSDWKEYLENALKLHKRGDYPDPTVRKRHVEEAQAVITKRMMAGDKRVYLQGITGDSKNIHRDTKPHMGTAVINLLKEDEIKLAKRQYEEKVKMMQPIKERLANGESLDDILRDKEIPMDAFALIRNHQEYGHPLEGFPLALIRNHQEYGHPLEGFPLVFSSEEEKVLGWLSDGMNRGITAPDSPHTFVNPNMDIVNAASPNKKKFTK